MVFFSVRCFDNVNYRTALFTLVVGDFADNFSYERTVRTCFLAGITEQPRLAIWALVDALRGIRIFLVVVWQIG
jgi:hypothetical protein